MMEPEDSGNVPLEPAGDRSRHWRVRPTPILVLAILLLVGACDEKPKKSRLIIDLPQLSTHVLDEASAHIQEAGCTQANRLYGPIALGTVSETVGGTVRLLSDKDQLFLETVERRRREKNLIDTPETETFVEGYRKSALEKMLAAHPEQAAALCLGHLALSFRPGGHRYEQWKAVQDTHQQGAFMEETSRELFAIIRAGRGLPSAEALEASRVVDNVVIVQEARDHLCPGWTVTLTDTQKEGSWKYQMRYRWDVCHLKSGFFVYDLMNDARPRLWPSTPKDGDADQRPSLLSEDWPESRIKDPIER